MQKWLSVLCATFLMISPAMAEDYKYQPEGCDFMISLPSEPVDTQRCHPQIPDRCEIMQSYTKVYDLDATINFYLSCRPVSENILQEYNRDMMSATLMAQPGIAELETYNTSYKEHDDYVVGGIMGAGPTPNGQNVQIYSASLWVGENSVMTVRAQLIGAEHEEADEQFATILRSISHSSEETSTDGAETSDDAASEEDTDSKEVSDNNDDSEELESDSAE